MDQLDTAAGEEDVVANEESVRTLAHKCRDGCVDLAAAAGIEDLGL
jgi:hypothetical protein